jgi:hypothetical protein
MRHNVRKVKGRGEYDYAGLYYFGASALRAYEYRTEYGLHVVAFSYNTPILKIAFWDDREEGIPQVTVYVNGRRYSKTTSRHLATFRHWMMEHYFDQFDDAELKMVHCDDTFIRQVSYKATADVFNR